MPMERKVLNTAANIALRTVGIDAGIRTARYLKSHTDPNTADTLEKQVERFVAGMATGGFQAFLPTTFAVNEAILKAHLKSSESLRPDTLATKTRRVALSSVSLVGAFAVDILSYALFVPGKARLAARIYTNVAVASFASLSESNNETSGNNPIVSSNTARRTS